MLLPLVGSVLMSALLAAVVVWIDSLPFLILPLVLLASVVLLPLSGMTLVYAIFGANIVADRDGQNVSVKQRFLGLGVGTTELIPFWKIREFVVEDVARAQESASGRVPAHDIAQWDPDARQEERQAHPPGRLQPAARGRRGGPRHRHGRRRGLRRALRRPRARPVLVGDTP